MEWETNQVFSSGKVLFNFGQMFVNRRETRRLVIEGFVARQKKDWKSPMFSR